MMTSFPTGSGVNELDPIRDPNPAPCLCLGQAYPFPDVNSLKDISGKILRLSRKHFNLIWVKMVFGSQKMFRNF